MYIYIDNACLTCDSTLRAAYEIETGYLRFSLYVQN